MGPTNADCLAGSLVGSVTEEYVKNSLQIAGGLVGAVLGFIATLLLLELVGFGNRADPITSGMLALLVFAPAGAVAGLVLGTGLAMRVRGDSAGSLARNSFKALGALILLCAAAGTAYYVYAVTTATPWLNPNAPNPILAFEVRLPAGTAPPASAADVVIDLETDINTMPAKSGSTQFRRDGDRPVLASEVELAYRTASRQVAVKIKGQPDRTYRVGLSAKAPHSSEFGPWQSSPDGGEIRYRAKWPGRD